MDKFSRMYGYLECYLRDLQTKCGDDNYVESEINSQIATTQHLINYMNELEEDE